MLVLVLICYKLTLTPPSKHDHCHDTSSYAGSAQKEKNLLYWAGLDPAGPTVTEQLGPGRFHPLRTPTHSAFPPSFLLLLVLSISLARFTDLSPATVTAARRPRGE
jgi:hypothetical protein